MPARPAGVSAAEKLGDNDGGSFLVGSGGVLGTGTYGMTTKLLPEARMAGYTLPPETLPRIKGSHYRNWIESCKGGETSCSNFSYAGPFAEMVLVGNIALRTRSKVDYDFVNGTVAGNPAAAKLLSKEYAEGWSLPV